MYLRKVTYQLGLRVKSLAPCFPQSHLENLALLVIGIAYSRSVSLPKAAGAVPDNRIQLESRVQRFERLAQCEKLVPLDALKPVAKKVLKSLPLAGVARSARRGTGRGSTTRSTSCTSRWPMADGRRHGDGGASRTRAPRT